MRLHLGIFLSFLPFGLLCADAGAHQGKLAEGAALHRVQLMLEKKDYGQVEKSCRTLLRDEGGLTSRAMRDKVMHLLGKSLEQQGKLDEAIGIYASMWARPRSGGSPNPELLEAWLRVLWKRNQPGDDGRMGDRQGAVEGGRKYLNQTERFKEKMNKEDLEHRQSLEKLVEQYEAELKKE